MRHRCIHCGKKYGVKVDMCEKCGKWDVVVPSLRTAKAPLTLVHDAPPAEPVELGGPRRASELREVALQRVSTGFEHWDEVLSGGLVRGNTLICAGDPGTGKTTTWIRVLSNFARALGGVGLYVSSEMGETELVTVAKRAGADLERLDVWHVVDVISVLEHMAKKPPPAVIFDSLQQFSAGDKEAGQDNTMKVVAREIARVVRSVGAIGVVISQVNRENLVAGPRNIEHVVDAIAYIEPDKLFIEKNRTGFAPKEVARQMIGGILI